MDIDKARAIDYWVGIPVCFLLDCFNNLKKALGIKMGISEREDKIAFLKLSELGAIILAYPLMNYVKQKKASAKFFFITFDRNKQVLKHLNNIIPEENVLVIREQGSAFIIDTLKTIAKLRKEKINIVFDLEFFSRFSAILSFLSGAAKRIGFGRYAFEGLYRGNLLTHKIQYNPLSHVSRNYLSLAQSMSKEEKNLPQLEEDISIDALCFPKYSSDEDLRHVVLDKIISKGIPAPEGNRLFLINPGEGILPLREWPIDNFISLIKRILEDENNYVILVGTNGTAEKTGLILTALNTSKCIDLAGETELEELLELFNLADVIISNDCGLGHLAMFSPIKKIIIFGPESPQVFGPLGENYSIVYSNWPCSPCLSVFNHRNSKCAENKCLSSIQVEDILNLI